MNSRNTSDGPNKRPHQKRRFLTAEQKFPIYLEAQANDQPVGELLRREGLSSTDLARIRQQVKAGALQRLRAKPGQKPNQVDGEAGAARKHERQEKERGLADLTVELAILRKKTAGGFVGPIAGQWIKAQTKLEILTGIEPSQQQGVSARRRWALLVIAQRRIVRWRQPARQGQNPANPPPGPTAPLPRVLPEEIAQIVALANRAAAVARAHRLLAVTAWDHGLFQASFSTFAAASKSGTG